MTSAARGSLATRIALLSVLIAVVTAVIAGVVGELLITRANENGARAALARVATTAQASIDEQPGLRTPRTVRQLLAIRVLLGTVDASGRVSSPSRLVRDALSPAQRQRLVAGHRLSLRTDVDGVSVYVEARPTTRGGVILLQRHKDATALGAAAVRRLFLALLIAVAIAIALGLVVAWRLARPLRRTAAAARALAGGARDVAVAPSGPREVAEVADAVNALSGALTVSEGRQREFLLSVSHDLRTPLTAISGYAESLADGVVPAEDVARVGGVLLGESHRLERLVRDLLDLARLDAADFRIEFAPVDVAELVAGAALAWQVRTERENVRLLVERPAHPLPVETDAARLRQALDGLVENALRVTPAGRPIVLAARAEIGASGPAVVVEVRDGGPGLRDDDLAVAFDRSALYDRYRGVRQVGTGLGLAIVHGLITRLGGSVEAGHAAEGGARFTVRMPAPATDRPAQDASSSTRVAT